MNVYAQSFSEAVKPDPYIWLSEWADTRFYLPQESTSEYGRFRVDRTPFIREPLDELSPMSPARLIVLIKPTQQAGTTIAMIVLEGYADLYPCPMLFITVTDQHARRFSKKRIDKSVRAIPSLRSKIKDPKSKDSGNTILLKEFPGGSWTFSGSNSPASYRSDSYKIAIGDDLDGFEPDIGGEGDPVDLLDRRTGSFHDSKVFLNSTPTDPDTSLIQAAYKTTSQGLFNVPCVRCDELQYLRFGTKDSGFGIKFFRNKKTDEVKEVFYECEHCHEKIDEHFKPEFISAGKYVHKHPGNIIKRGFKYNALVSPLGWKNSWKRISEEFLEAKKQLDAGRPAKMRSVTNTLMADCFDEGGERPEWKDLIVRVEDYPPNIVPPGGLLLTCGVDTQDDRLAVLVRAWGIGEENWLVFHTELWGDPAQDDVWLNLDEIINTGYPHESGLTLYIQSVGVDSQGHRTQPVYNYCRVRGPRVFALQGATKPGKPIIGLTPSTQDVDYKGKKIKDGVQLWTIGTDTAKSIIYSRLKMAGSGAGVYHWHKDTTEEYFKQLTAEKLITKYNQSGFPVKQWIIAQGKRNEVLDCETYAYAAAIKVGMGRPGFFDEIIRAIEQAKVERPKEEKSNGFIPKREGWLR